MRECETEEQRAEARFKQTLGEISHITNIAARELDTNSHRGRRRRHPIMSRGPGRRCLEKKGRGQRDRDKDWTCLLGTGLQGT